VTDGPGPDLSAEVSADGRLLLWDLDQTSIPVFEQRAGGAARQLTSRVEEVLWIWPMPGGAELAALVMRDGERLIVVIDLATGAERTVAAGGERFTVGPDGFVIARDSKLYLVPHAGGPERELGAYQGKLMGMLPGPGGDIYLGVLGPGGAQHLPAGGGPLVQDAPPPWCALLPATTGGWSIAVRCEVKPEVVLLPPGARPGDPPALVLQGPAFFTADGTALISLLDGRATRRDLASGKETTIATVPFVLDGWAPSLDGQTIYYTNPVAHVRRMVITNFADRTRP
jgi:hypothetical protein